MAVWKLAVVIAMLLLTGCASPRSVSNNDLQAIKSVTIIGPQNPDHIGLGVGDLGSAVAAGTGIGPGAAAGVLGGSVAGSEKQPYLTEALRPQGLRLGDEISAAAFATLRQQGYEVRMPESAGAESSDAVLDLRIDQIAYERRVWGLIGPKLALDVKLTERASGRTLFYQIYLYDLHTISLGPSLGLTPDEKYGFERPEDVLSHPEVVVAGFRAAIPMIMSHLGQAFRKQ